jgi:hypothetical protein
MFQLCLWTIASFQVRDVSINESIKIALEKRPEVFEQGLDIANARIKVKQEKNQLLPKLDFEAGIRYQDLQEIKEMQLTEHFHRTFKVNFLDLLWRSL